MLHSSAASNANSNGARGPEANLRRFISAAKESPALKGVCWEAVQWFIDPNDPVARKIRAHRQYEATLTFTTRETSSREYARVPVDRRQPLPTGYAEFAKADLRHYAESNTPGLDVLRRCLSAHQFLEQALRSRARDGQVTDLTLRHFELAEEALVRELGTATSYKVAQHLERIAATVDGRKLARATIGFQSGLQRPSNGDVLTEEGTTKGMEKMISGDALDAIARISAAPADDYQRFISRILDLFVCCGFRAGEVLRLAADCWVSVEPPRVGDAPAVLNEGIQYIAEKGSVHSTKWLPRQSVALARRAIDDLTRLTKPMREVARWMEAHPGRLWAFRELDANHMIAGREACSRMGLAPNSHANWKLFRERRDDTVFFRVGDIEADYLKGHNAGPVLALRSGHQQKLSETLILCWENQFHATRPTLTFLPRTMTYGMLADNLCPAASRRDQVRGILSGTGFSVTTHQFRHWLNTLADNSGLSEVHQAKWFGRLEIVQNKTYQHKTLEERRRLTWELILKGEAHGEVARMASAVAIEDREAFVKSVVEAAHTTIYGVCVHNFACSPCPNHMQCLRKCGDYLRIKGDQQQRMALMDLRRMEQIRLEQTQLALSDGFTEAAKWVEHHNEIIEGIDEALAVDEDLAVADGTEVNVFPGKSNQTKLLT